MGGQAALLVDRKKELCQSLFFEVIRAHLWTYTLCNGSVTAQVFLRLKGSSRDEVADNKIAAFFFPKDMDPEEASREAIDRIMEQFKEMWNSKYIVKLRSALAGKAESSGSVRNYKTWAWDRIKTTCHRLYKNNPALGLLVQTLEDYAISCYYGMNGNSGYSYAAAIYLAMAADGAVVKKRPEKWSTYRAVPSGVRMVKVGGTTVLLPEAMIFSAKVCREYERPRACVASAEGAAGTEKRKVDGRKRIEGESKSTAGSAVPLIWSPKAEKMSPRRILKTSGDETVILAPGKEGVYIYGDVGV